MSEGPAQTSATPTALRRVDGELYELRAWVELESGPGEPLGTDGQSHQGAGTLETQVFLRAEGDTWIRSGPQDADLRAWVTADPDAGPGAGGLISGGRYGLMSAPRRAGWWLMPQATIHAAEPVSLAQATAQRRGLWPDPSMLGAEHEEEQAQEAGLLGTSTEPGERLRRTQARLKEVEQEFERADDLTEAAQQRRMWLLKELRALRTAARQLRLREPRSLTEFLRDYHTHSSCGAPQELWWASLTAELRGVHRLAASIPSIRPTRPATGQAHGLVHAQRRAAEQASAETLMRAVIEAQAARLAQPERLEGDSESAYYEATERGWITDREPTGTIGALDVLLPDLGARYHYTLLSNGRDYWLGGHLGPQQWRPLADVWPLIERVGWPEDGGEEDDTDGEDSGE